MASLENVRSYLADQLHTIENAAKDGVLHISPNQFEDAGKLLFSTLLRGGFTTFLVNSRTGWDPTDTYYEIPREQARQGKNITRLFLLPHRHYLREIRLRKHVELDTLAGIKVKFAIIGEPLRGIDLEPDNLEFGIWDDQIVCWIEKQSPCVVASQWRISEKQEDLDLAQKIRNILLDQNTFDATLSPDEFALEEPLIKSAPAIAALADFMCKGDYIDRESCTWYHKPWQYLRLLDLVSTPTWHSSFYLNALSDGVKKGEKKKVLISGTADYSMLAYVLYVYERISAQCDVTVLDLCETPLMMSKWYASTKGVEITCAKKDILKFAPDEKFDYIVTDAFITRFNNKMKRKVVSRWRKLLNPGGKVVTTIHLEPGVKLDIPVIPSEIQIENFVNRAEKLASLWQDFVLVSPDEIKTMSQHFWERARTNPLRDKADVHELFSSSGFNLDIYQETLVKGELKPTIYAEIVASSSE